MTLRQLNDLEAELVERLHWRLAVSEEEFFAVLELICRGPRDDSVKGEGHLHFFEEPLELSAISKVLANVQVRSNFKVQSAAPQPLKVRCGTRSSLSGFDAFVCRLRRTCFSGPICDRKG